MDSNDSQFNMWNDFDLKPMRLLLFFIVNELLPILKVFNRFNPLMLNAFTNWTHSFPISIDSTLVNREKSNFLYSTSLHDPLGNEIEAPEKSIDLVYLGDETLENGS